MSSVSARMNAAQQVPRLCECEEHIVSLSLSRIVLDVIFGQCVQRFSNDDERYCMILCHGHIMMHIFKERELVSMSAYYAQSKVTESVFAFTPAARESHRDERAAGRQGVCSFLQRGLLAIAW